MYITKHIGIVNPLHVLSTLIEEFYIMTVTDNDTHLTYEARSYLGSALSEVIFWSQLFFTTPGVQELFQITHVLTLKSNQCMYL